MTTSTKRQSKAAIELAAARARIAELEAGTATVPAPVVLTPEQAALKSGANAYFLVDIVGIEVAIRKDTLRFMKNWPALNLLENLEAAIVAGETVSFEPEATTFTLHVGNEKVADQPVKCCGVTVSTARASSAAYASRGAGFTRTTPKRSL